MLNESTIVVLFQYAAQAMLAFLVMFLLNRFYKNYQNKYFQYWSWSWLGLMVYLIGSSVALASVFYLSTTHPLRTISSAITVGAGLFQALWLFIGSYELSHEKKFARKPVQIASLLIIPLALGLVFAFINNPEAAVNRIFLRVGVKSFILGISFVFSASLIYKLRKSGIGIKFIIVAFLLYGLQQFNYFFSFLAPVLEFDYPLETPYYLGIFDFLLQTIMGIGMIINVLEVERLNLKKTNVELDTFLYRASHDLRAPLTAIKGLTSAARQINEKKEVANFIDLIQIKTDQADQVIRDIITLRKGQKVGLNIKRVNLNKLVTDYFNMVTSPVNKKVVLHVDSDQYIISSDPDRLQTIISNLISNAIKYHDMSQPEPSIRVDMQRTSDGVMMKIADNGKGIDEKHLPKIFDMFYRANTDSKGSGLGLYLVKDALTSIESKIEVTSVPGVGTSFKLYLKNLTSM
ncbi:MAG: HAMP domain-containing sensor histidine kinase [Cyclobacteriaceae bacterium]